MTPEEVYQDWWNSEGIRFLNEDNSVPSQEDRVKHAFMSGLRHNYIRECMKATLSRIAITKQIQEEKHDAPSIIE
jgi:hypothetical protein